MEGLAVGGYDEHVSLAERDWNDRSKHESSFDDGGIVGVYGHEWQYDDAAARRNDPATLEAQCGKSVFERQGEQTEEEWQEEDVPRTEDVEAARASAAKAVGEEPRPWGRRSDDGGYRKAVAETGESEERRCRRQREQDHALG